MTNLRINTLFEALPPFEASPKKVVNFIWRGTGSSQLDLNDNLKKH
jgi:hypothetical protein